jgi:ComF family protein
LFKFRGKVGLVAGLGRLLTATLPSGLLADAVIPVPLSSARLRTREFNQSLLLADRVAAHLGLPVDYLNLIRVLDTAPQTTLPRSARLQNVRQAFALKDPGRIVGKRILLVDDVFTTGTTVNECAKVLCEAGAQAVTVLALARSVDLGFIPDSQLPAAAYDTNLRGARLSI